MNNWWITLPLAVPLVTAIVTLALRPHLRWARAASVFGGVALLGASTMLIAAVAEQGVVVLEVGGWSAPYGITLVADVLSASLVAVTAVVALAVLVYAQRDIDEARERLGFHSLYWIVVLGVVGAFVTGDLFNLYVWFEVLLIASFVLLVLGSAREQLKAARGYVLLNVLASLCFLAAVGLLYGLTGTLNMAELAQRIPEVEDTASLGAVAMLLLLSFGIKAGVFPLFFWLPSAYPAPPIAITALFAGLLTKVGVYALLRAFTLLFPLGPGPIRDVLLFIACATMVAGVLGAAFQTDVRRILSFHIVSQIGYMVLGLALHSPLALLGTVFYIVHHIVVKTNLFLLCGAVAKEGGSFELADLGGLYERRPGLAVLFLIPALSLAGLPPLSGFWAKFLIISAGLQAGEYLVSAVALAVGLLTLYSMLKIWLAAFLGESKIQATWRPGTRTLAPIAALAAITLGLGLFADPLAAFAEQSAEQLLSPQTYVDAVLGRPVMNTLPVRMLRFVVELLSFAVFYLYELAVSSLRVAHDVVTPRDRMRPGIIAVPTDAKTDVELTILSSLLTLTPGTLCVAVAPDGRTMFVHAMFIDDGDVDAVRRELKRSVETRVLRLVRAWPFGGDAQEATS